MRLSPTSSKAVRTAAGFGALVVALMVPFSGTAQAGPTTTAATAAATTHDACGAVSPGEARCLAVVRDSGHSGFGVRGPAAAAQAGRNAAAATLPTGYGPADLQSAYRLPATGGKGQTIALIEAFGDPTAASDLAVYRTTYGLPACTVAGGCLRVVNQKGKSSPLPAAGTTKVTAGWQTETSLDLDMASAICPDCHILLVQADDQTDADLGAAAAVAPSLGATEVSNSYGIQESNGVSGYAKDYQHAGVAYVASSGDYGYTVPSEPAVFPGVIAVGGTSLTKSTDARGWTETAWDLAGSGCSAWEAKPAWQHDTDCPGRMVSDVSAEADPTIGVAVYSTVDGGWLPVGGTSASAPIIAGVIALAGNPGKLPNASYLYARTKDLYDVTSGTNVNGITCGGSYLCTAGKGYDGPTGNGTPDGVGAF
ncbi:S53 family peptidase [Streptacidiphilus albus]|uniref:S53 family peptidase n=1 Tax=Streptacidiphilus albus TaxID=105425 RepID=UPI00054BC0AB|nr:S53 family peptidase [Streptacidiphilus albus]